MALHLLSIVLGESLKRVKTIYFEHEDTFEEEIEFIEKCREEYQLNLFKTRKNFKEGLKQVLSEFPSLKAVVMGVRKSDPYSQSLSFFTPTDLSWPQMMRVNPVLEWDYCEIWEYLKVLKVSFNPLYNLGYTSIGKKSNTVRNESLKQANGDYLPAWMLKNEICERDSRI